ncbi:Os02g0793600, partial [Oryza sativa Japonica Group]
LRPWELTRPSDVLTRVTRQHVVQEHILQIHGHFHDTLDKRNQEVFRLEAEDGENGQVVVLEILSRRFPLYTLVRAVQRRPHLLVLFHLCENGVSDSNTPSCVAPSGKALLRE